MKVSFNDKRLASIRMRDAYFSTRSAGKLSIGTALKNVGDTYEQLLSNVDHGQAIGDCSEAVRDINHMLMRLEAIKAALENKVTNG